METAKIMMTDKLQKRRIAPSVRRGYYPCVLLKPGLHAIAGDQGQKVRVMTPTMTPTEILTKETFASMAASVLRFIVDGTITDPPMLERIQAFQAVKARAINETGDIRGVRISTPDISGETDEPGSSDYNTNAILRGSLLMVAAMLEGDIDSDAYRDAREQLAVGVSKVIDAVQAERKPRQPRRRV